MVCYVDDIGGYEDLNGFIATHTQISLLLLGYYFYHSSQWHEIQKQAI